MTWLELIAWLLIGGAIWTLGGLWLAWSETPAPGERRRDDRRAAPTGTGPVQDYATVAQDYHVQSEEDPPAYGPCVTVTCARPGCGGTMFAARDGSRCNKCGRLLGSRVTEDAYGAAMQAAIMNEMAADDAKHRALLKRQLARPRLIKRRRDGLKLTDEATADVLRTIFGDDPPPR